MVGQFEIYEVAIEAAVQVMGLVEGVPKRYASLADQATRAVAGVPLSLAEGRGRMGRDRRHFWRIAYGSSLETTAAVRLLARVGAIPATPAEEALGLLDRVQAMAWRLTRR